VLSKDGIKTFFSVLGAAWLIFEISEYFKFIPKDSIPPAFIYILLAISLAVVIITRHPITKTSYKTKDKELCIEVRIADIFDLKGDKIISTNTSFDTDVANGIIAKDTLQGKFTEKNFGTNLNLLNTTIHNQLSHIAPQSFPKIAGNQSKYPMGTTVRVNVGQEIYYLMAMSEFDYNNNASTTFDDVIVSIESAFKFIDQQGLMHDIVIPLIGKGRGRLTINRKRLIARIAQTFIKASEPRKFTNKLTIVIYPKDAENFDINLYEVRDLLNNYLP